MCVNSFCEDKTARQAHVDVYPRQQSLTIKNMSDQ